jgi:L-2-hydroxyglutarate oxidase LhgO
MDRVQVIIIGAGVVGLATGARLSALGLECVVVERADAIGTETSARNSEVIHAGIYYPAGSLKARLCVEGRRKLYAYCAARGIGHKRIGKLIVATDEAEETSLAQIAQRAEINGLVGEEQLQLLTGAEAKALEPQLHATAALFSPATGIIDSHGLMLSFQGELESAGGMIAFETEFVAARVTGDGFVVRTRDTSGAETEIGCSTLINAAGLRASIVAGAIEGLSPSSIRPTFYSRGCYFSLSGKAPFTRLIYPVPKPESLGVHLTLDLGGQVKFGPDHEWIDNIDYHVDPARGDAFYEAIRRYYPNLGDGALSPAYSGIRPKIERPGGSNTDFAIDGPSIHGVPGLINLFGIESPGLTSSLSIADEVAGRLGLIDLQN